MLSRIRSLDQPRDVPNTINLLNSILAQPKIHLLHLQPVACSETFLQRTGNRCCLGQRLLALWRIHYLLKELRPLLMVELIEGFEDRLALRR